MSAVIALLLPTSAVGQSTGGDAGIVVAEALVGKEGGCLGEAGDGDVGGAGLGLGAPLFVKHAHYEIHAPTGSVVSARFGAGSIDLCGNLLPVFGAIGASCELTHSDQGGGRLGFADSELWISDFGWAYSVSGAFAGSGKVGTTPSTPTDWLLLSGRAHSPKTFLDCKSKGSGKSGPGATIYDFLGQYEVVPFAAQHDDAHDVYAELFH